MTEPSPDNISTPASSESDASMDNSSDEFRVGHGYDIHRLIADDRDAASVCLAGVNIACRYRIEAHSDGDVVVHAIIDALLGALALGDLGDHFPDNDVGNRDRYSITMLEHVCNTLVWPKWRIANVDSTLIAQTPRVSDHRLSMRETLAKTLQLNIDRVSVKATTHEGLDSIGKECAIASHAVVLLKSALRQ